jgi:HSP20 family molecular chaperone IbpA
MFNTVYGEFPVNCYSYKDYSKVIDAITNDVLNLASSANNSSYLLKEIDSNLVFDCIATSITKENLSITFKDRKLIVKTIDESKDLSYFKPVNISLTLRKDIDVKSSFAELENGVLKITMPLKEDSKEKKISFK